MLFWTTTISSQGEVASWSRSSGRQASQISLVPREGKEKPWRSRSRDTVKLILDDLMFQQCSFWICFLFGRFLGIVVNPCESRTCSVVSLLHRWMIVTALRWWEQCRGCTTTICWWWQTWTRPEKSMCCTGHKRLGRQAISRSGSRSVSTSATFGVDICSFHYIIGIHFESFKLLGRVDGTLSKDCSGLS